MQPIYDVVPNHMNDQIVGTQVRFPRALKEWRDSCAVPTDCDAGDPFMSGFADLNTNHAEVSARFMQEFRNLRDNYGAKGLHFDFVRGYEPERVDLWMKNFGNQAFCVGELWKGPSEYPANDWRNQASWQDALKDWSDRSHCTVFDFALKERMQNASLAEWRHSLNGNPAPDWRQTAVTLTTTTPVIHPDNTAANTIGRCPIRCVTSPIPTSCSAPARQRCIGRTCTTGAVAT